MFLQILKNVWLVRVYANVTVTIRWALTPAHVELATHLPVMDSVALVSYKCRLYTDVQVSTLFKNRGPKFIRELCCYINLIIFVINFV